MRTAVHGPASTRCSCRGRSPARRHDPARSPRIFYRRSNDRRSARSRAQRALVAVMITYAQDHRLEMTAEARALGDLRPICRRSSPNSPVPAIYLRDLDQRWIVANAEQPAGSMGKTTEELVGHSRWSEAFSPRGLRAARGERSRGRRERLARRASTRSCAERGTGRQRNVWSLEVPRARTREGTNDRLGGPSLDVTERER